MSSVFKVTIGILNNEHLVLWIDRSTSRQQQTLFFNRGMIFGPWTKVGKFLVRKTVDLNIEPLTSRHELTASAFPICHFGSQNVYKGIDPQNGGNGRWEICRGGLCVVYNGFISFDMYFRLFNNNFPDFSEGKQKCWIYKGGGVWCMRIWLEIWDRSMENNNLDGWNVHKFRLLQTSLKKFLVVNNAMKFCQFFVGSQFLFFISPLVNLL